MEPEIVNVAEWLISCGADIRGVGSPTIVIEGTNGKLLSPENPYVAIP
jgi:UDP-N-acetylglucosamine enolpyruvyl transferase